MSKCTKRGYMVLPKDPLCNDDEDYHYPLGQCMKKCGDGEIRDYKHKCAYDPHPCNYKAGYKRNQCTLKCERPSEMRIKKKLVLLPIMKEHICTKKNRRNPVPGYEYNWSNNRCLKKCNEGSTRNTNTFRCVKNRVDRNRTSKKTKHHKHRLQNSNTVSKKKKHHKRRLNIPVAVAVPNNNNNRVYDDNDIFPDTPPIDGNNNDMFANHASTLVSSHNNASTLVSSHNNAGVQPVQQKKTTIHPPHRAITRNMTQLALRNRVLNRGPPFQ